MRLIAAFSSILGLILATTIALAESFDTPPPSGNFNWKVYDYNASGQAFRSRQPDPVTAGTDGGIAFDFLYTPDTALFITTHPSYRGDLLGDLSGKTSVSARVGITVTSGAPVFTYGEPDGGGGTPANTRFFFQ